MSFTHPPSRHSTHSYKWDKYAGRDILPLWVADMDFPAPDSVIAALHARVAHGIFGYSNPPPSLMDAIVTYSQQHYGWAIDPSWLVPLPGLVVGLNLACRAVGQRGDAVITATPIYPPFMSAPKQAERELITVPLCEVDGQWRWDFAALEAAITPCSRLLLLCHPHNPVGRQWRPDELRQLIAIAKRHQLIICSDEIHCDLLLETGARHQALASLDPEFAAQTITLMAPSKTWNLPGLGCAFAIIPDANLRRRFRQAMAGLVPNVNVLGYTACEAAYRDDGQWHAELISTLRTNHDLLLAAINQAGSRLRMTVAEATYLAWIDARAIDAINPAAQFEALGLGVSDGKDFGLPGWVRLNFGCPTSTIVEAIARLKPLLEGDAKR